MCSEDEYQHRRLFKSDWTEEDVLAMMDSLDVKFEEFSPNKVTTFKDSSGMEWTGMFGTGIDWDAAFKRAAKEYINNEKQIKK